MKALYYFIRRSGKFIALNLTLNAEIIKHKLESVNDDTPILWIPAFAGGTRLIGIEDFMLKIGTCLLTIDYW
jgi:hypothetical protein